MWYDCTLMEKKKEKKKEKKNVNNTFLAKLWVNFSLMGNKLSLMVQ